MNTVGSKNHQLGGLYVQSREGQQLVFPLKHTEVEAKVAGNLSRVEVTQKFQNPFTATLEAVYVFPLPDEAAVDDMEIKIGDRIIKGNIKKREEAVAIYEQAKQQGRTAGLLEQERDNIFTQSLANIKPGEEIDVTIRYTDSLKFEGGDYEFVFPMVVGPRYIPGTPIAPNATSATATAPMTLNEDSDRVPDAERLNAPILPPGTRSGHDINVTVEIDAGVAIKDVRSPSHQIRIEHLNSSPLAGGDQSLSSPLAGGTQGGQSLSSPLAGGTQGGQSLSSPLAGGTQGGQIVRVKLGGEDTIPNKDLILRYQIAGNNTQATVLTQSDSRGGHFAIYLIPALEYSTNEIVPKDVVFLVDTSGSQQGDPLMKCQELMRRFINGLNPYDTFSILDFSNSVRQLSPTPLPNTPENRAKAINYINNLQAGGATEMLSGIRAAINVPTPPGRLRSVVLLSDGYIGNENEILAEVQKHLQSGNRLYSFGAGSSVNRFLLNRVAEIGRGISRIIRHDEPTEEVAEKFFLQINNPVLMNIQITWEGTGENPAIYPAVAPDLFAEQPLVLFGRKQDGIAGKLHVSGIAAGGKRYENTFHLNFDETGNPAIAQLWGRARIKDLTKQMVSYDTKAGVEAVTETALTYQLLSQYTAFVAVSEDVRVDSEGEKITVQVPVEMPEGVSYEGIFGEADAASPPAAPMSATARSQSYHKKARSVPQSLAINNSATDWMEQESDSFELFSIAPDIVNVEPSLACMFEPVSMPPATPKARDRKLQVISITGLEQAAIDALTQHLQLLQFPSGNSGEIVFEFKVVKGRVKQIMLDEEASTLKDAEVVEIIKRALTTWRPPQAANGTVHITLRILP
jgi:Ca-activated chloride channel family protein